MGIAPDGTSERDPAEWCWDPTAWSTKQKLTFWMWFIAFCPVCLILLGQEPEGGWRRRTEWQRRWIEGFAPLTAEERAAARPALLGVHGELYHRPGDRNAPRRCPNCEARFPPAYTRPLPECTLWWQQGPACRGVFGSEEGPCFRTFEELDGYISLAPEERRQREHDARMEEWEREREVGRKAWVEEYRLRACGEGRLDTTLAPVLGRGARAVPPSPVDCRFASARYGCRTWRLVRQSLLAPV